MQNFTALTSVLDQIESVLVWGLVATIVLTVVMYGSQAMGLSRLSLPFLLGSCLSPDRGRATVYCLVMYTLGGWAFAVLYAWLFQAIGFASWWLGLLTECSTGFSCWYPCWRSCPTSIRGWHRPMPAPTPSDGWSRPGFSA